MDSFILVGTNLCGYLSDLSFPYVAFGFKADESNMLLLFNKVIFNSNEKFLLFCKKSSSWKVKNIIIQSHIFELFIVAFGLNKRKE